jgi:hypothetical protein
MKYTVNHHIERNPLRQRTSTLQHSTSSFTDRKGDDVADRAYQCQVHEQCNLATGVKGSIHII